MAKKRSGRVGRPPGPAPDPLERRALLIDAAVRTIRRVGPGASMEAIAAESGLSKPILYSAFKDKGGLASALSEVFTAELTQAVVEPLASVDEPRLLVRAAIDAFVDFVEREPDIYRFIAQGSGVGDRGAVGHRLVSGIGEQLAIVLGGALRRASADSGAGEPWAFMVLGSVFMGAEWWLERQTMTRHDFVEYLTDFVWAGLGGGLARLEGPIVADDLAASLLGADAAADVGTAAGSKATTARGKRGGRLARK